MYKRQDQQFLEDLGKATGVKVRIDDITNNNRTEGQYSIRTLPDGSKMTVIDTGQDVFKGVAPKDYPKVAKRVIMENFVGKNLPVGEYDLGAVAKRTAGEYVHPPGTIAVSYTHLDVYKRQASNPGLRYAGGTDLFRGIIQ